MRDDWERDPSCTRRVTNCSASWAHKKASTLFRLTPDCIEIFRSCSDGNSGLREAVLDRNRRSACTDGVRFRRADRFARGEQPQPPVTICAKQSGVADAARSAKRMTKTTRKCGRSTLSTIVSIPR